MGLIDDYLIHMKVTEDYLIHMGLIDDYLIHMKVTENYLIHMKVTEDYLIHMGLIDAYLIHMQVTEDYLIHMKVIEDYFIHMGVINDYLIHRCKKLGMKGKGKGGKKRARKGERELEREEGSNVVECKTLTGSQCPTGQDRILFRLCGKPGRCINFPTTHSVSCPSIILELFSSPFVLWHTPLTKGIKNHPQKNKSSNHTKLLTPGSHPTFFPSYPTIINLTTQQQPKEREKREREREKNK
jgi:hypothetical protein